MTSSVLAKRRYFSIKWWCQQIFQNFFNFRNFYIKMHLWSKFERVSLNTSGDIRILRRYFVCDLMKYDVISQIRANNALYAQKLITLQTEWWAPSYYGYFQPKILLNNPRLLGCIALRQFGPIFGTRRISLEFKIFIWTKTQITAGNKTYYHRFTYLIRLKQYQRK